MSQPSSEEDIAVVLPELRGVLMGCEVLAATLHERGGNLRLQQASEWRYLLTLHAGWSRGVRLRGGGRSSMEVTVDDLEAIVGARIAALDVRADRCLLLVLSNGWTLEVDGSGPRPLHWSIDEVAMDDSGRGGSASSRCEYEGMLDYHGFSASTARPEDDLDEAFGGLPD
jgi:hypothetical protein